MAKGGVVKHGEIFGIELYQGRLVNGIGERWARYIDRDH
jgi:hypothetical protein